jgi:hypothetical protein
VRVGELDPPGATREVKPDIPETGAYAIPMHDEVELGRSL